jgi:hypothetical protein
MLFTKGPPPNRDRYVPLHNSHPTAKPNLSASTCDHGCGGHCKGIGGSVLEPFSDVTGKRMRRIPNPLHSRNRLSRNRIFRLGHILVIPCPVVHP